MTNKKRAGERIEPCVTPHPREKEVRHVVPGVWSSGHLNTSYAIPAMCSSLLRCQTASPEAQDILLNQRPFVSQTDTCTFYCLTEDIG